MAMGILIMAVTIVSKLELRSLMRVLNDRDELEHVFLVKKEQYLQGLRKHKEQRKFVQKSEESDVKITSQVAAIDQKSSLAGLKHRLFAIRSTVSWKFEREARDMSMVMFVPRYDAKKDADKEKKS